MAPERALACQVVGLVAVREGAGGVGGDVSEADGEDGEVGACASRALCAEEDGSGVAVVVEKARRKRGGMVERWRGAWLFG